MGSLFWKIFFSMLATLLLASAGTGLLVHRHNQERIHEVEERLQDAPRVEFGLAFLEEALHSRGVAATKRVMRRSPGGRRGIPILVIDKKGRDLLGRRVPQEELQTLRKRLSHGEQIPGVRQVISADGGDHLLVAQRWFREHRKMPAAAIAYPLGRLVIGLLASLFFSALLAWYLTRPLRHISKAANCLAEGDLSVRVMPKIGRRRDEVADLGRDFDQMAGRLETLVDAQQRLVNDVSHELRSPLARLQVATELIRQQPERSEALLARIESETKRLDELVGQLLTLSRLESGDELSRDEYLDVGVLLGEIIKDINFEADHRGRQVVFEESQEFVVNANAELLRRAFENVIRNAVSFSPQGGVVTVKAEATGRQRLKITVCDQGKGVEKAQLGSLFEPFVRLDQKRTGYGLGLAIARRALEAHEGSIRAYNRTQGHGLCVEMMLPLAEI